MSLGELERLANNVLHIKNFRGVFMREALPAAVACGAECGILNLGDLTSNGTHWTCYVKTDDGRKFYFDSFGDAPPPYELVNYLGGGDGLVYNDCRIQNFDDPPICGHLCLEVLRRNANGEDWTVVLQTLRNNKYAWESWWQR